MTQVKLKLKINNYSRLLPVDAGFIPADSSKGTEGNSGTDGDFPYKQLQQDLDSSSKVMIDHLLNNLETKAVSVFNRQIYWVGEK